MAGKHSAEILAVAPCEKVDKLITEQVGKPALRAKHTSITPVSVNGQIYLFAYNRAQNYFDVYEFTPAAPWLTAVKAKPAIGKAKDIINAFTLGNLPYICVYTAKNGVFEIYSVANDLSFSQPYKFYRNHELAVSQHFTTLKPFTQFGQIAFLGYRGDTGYVAMYTVGMAATSPAPDVPPLLMLPVWSHPWAPGWTRFAFFQFGGEPFFLKTNTKVLNVNIDHILDTMAAGTAEVGTLLQAQLPDALRITHVEPFALGNGEPYFVTYISSSGAATLNRIHSDCLGWTQVAKFNAPDKSAVIAPVAVGNKVFLIFA
jgi:hypothetical protein